MSLPERFLALTLCIEEAVRENRLQELPSLIEARGAILEELAGAGENIPVERMQGIQEVEARLMASLKTRRNAALERLNALRSLKTARAAYRHHLAGRL